ncbi:hypothetical protein [Stagnihabitans tardus]|uniref:Uncharacterized protein n=1 Tax=Stagnihabitans tardus TaxID=2699202 RepID=A0AAE5BRI2_9RHOB|nr:hypothetical protein [Stagnihabitans tardus]NBZ86585.1 hypothetical protein [Stagnihabitans tardus]
MTDPHFLFGFKTTGTPGAEDFALWLVLENLTDRDVVITRALFSVGTQQGHGWVSMELAPAEPVPLGPLARDQGLHLCLHRGAGLPPGLGGEADWAKAWTAHHQGREVPDFPWPDCHSLTDLMRAGPWEFDLWVNVTSTRRVFPGWSGNERRPLQEVTETTQLHDGLLSLHLSNPVEPREIKVPAHETLPPPPTPPVQRDLTATAIFLLLLALAGLWGLFRL